MYIYVLYIALRKQEQEKEQKKRFFYCIVVQKDKKEILLTFRKISIPISSVDPSIRFVRLLVNLS